MINDIVIWTVLAGVLGVVIGSFLNVVVFRTQKNEPLKGRSKCQTCKEPVAAVDLVPILSYINLKGRCRKCSSVIEWQYPAIELITGVLFGLLFARAAMGIGFPVFVDDTQWMLLFVRDTVAACFLLIIFVYDYKYSYILDRFSLPGIVLVVLFNLLLGASLDFILLGGLFLGSFFAFQFLVSKGRWIGGGDIRMGVLMGCLLGPALGLVALFLSYLLGAVIGVYLIVFKHRRSDSHVPFGTFLALGTIAAMIWGADLLAWYLGFLG